MVTNKTLIVGVAVVLLLVATAAVASYTTRESLEPKTVAQAPTPTPHKPYQKMAAAQPQQPAQPACDDKNIVGTVGGGVAGGLVGSQIGKGSGKTAATIGGVVGGAYLGNQYLPTRNVTCR
jgi:outer membrane lipoprotein SlyB